MSKISLSIELRLVTADNWRECAGLSLAPQQLNWLPSNLYSIAEMQFYPDSCGRAIYNDKDEMIGFALYGRDSDTQRLKIFRFMIDQRYQGQGYGRVALKTILAQLRVAYSGEPIFLCYQRDNVVAQRLYAHLGFQEVAIDENKKVTARLTPETMGIS